LRKGTCADFGAHGCSSKAEVGETQKDKWRPLASQVAALPFQLRWKVRELRPNKYCIYWYHLFMSSATKESH